MKSIVWIIVRRELKVVRIRIYGNSESLLFFVSYCKEMIQMMKIYKEAGERIYLARIMRGYTRENLAELADISPKFLYEIETGKKGFSSLVLLKLSQSLQVDCDYIMTGRSNISYDQRLIATLELFNKRQSEQIALILEEIHELMSEDKPSVK